MRIVNWHVSLWRGDLLPEPEETTSSASSEAGAASTFSVQLENFSGPFDVLLSLISKHKLDVTEVALATVTDDFIRYLQQHQNDWDLDQASHFVVVAATLLDVKTARLLPGGEVEDEEDFALLEARDLLFARLLQYRAYKQVSGWFAEQCAGQDVRVARRPVIPAEVLSALPDVVFPQGAVSLAVALSAAVQRAAGVALPEVNVDHLHGSAVTVEQQVSWLTERLVEVQECSFADLVSDTADPLMIAVRFLAVLELYREQRIGLEQSECFGELLVRWSL